MLDGDASDGTCDQATALDDARLDDVLDRFLLQTPTAGLPTRTSCDAPSAEGVLNAIEGANALRMTIERDCGSRDGERPCTPDQATFRRALVRYHLRLAARLAWTWDESEIAAAGFQRTGLERDMDLSLFFAQSVRARRAHAQCEIEQPSPWEAPETWVERSLPGTSATLRAPRGVFRRAEHGVDGVELTTTAVRGDRARAMSELERLGFRAHAWPSRIAAPADAPELFGGGRALAVLASTTDDHLIVIAALDSGLGTRRPLDARLEAGVLHALATLRREQGRVAFVGAPLVVDDPELVWITRRPGDHWSWNAQIPLPLGRILAVAVFFTADPMRCDPVPLFARSDGGREPGCDDELNRGHGAQFVQSLPRADGRVNVVTVVPSSASLDDEAAVARGREILSRVQVTSAIWDVE